MLCVRCACDRVCIPVCYDVLSYKHCSLHVQIRVIFAEKKNVMGLIEQWVQQKGRENAAGRLEVMSQFTKEAMSRVDEKTSSVLDDVCDLLEVLRKEVLNGEH